MSSIGLLSSSAIIVQYCSLVNTELIRYSVLMSKFSKWLEGAMFVYGGRKYGGAALSRDIGVRRATVSNWLLEKDIPRREHIARLAIHFGTSSRHIYQTLELEPPGDLNDVLEEITAILNGVPSKEQQKVLAELRSKYASKS